MGVAIVVTIIVVIIGRKMLDATLAMARAGNKKAEDIELDVKVEIFYILFYK